MTTNVERLRCDLEFAVPGLDRHSERLNLLLAAVWDQALDHVWVLNDPAYTVISDTESIYPIVTSLDIAQAKQENPYVLDDEGK